MPEESKSRNLVTHDGNTWWNLPKTPQEEPNPPYEGPVGGPWGRQVLDWVTYAGVSHASVRGYLVIAAILSIFTFMEWRLFSVDAFGDSGRNAIMISLSVIKFTMVVAFFMHLRFERRHYSYSFGVCMALGISIFVALLLLVRHHGAG